jgi:alkanesulfonate monooxygenase SsuD/methylene tetrahydromethanopterin reductase-like flavin-dependent oxidoreductase (luciferase family)
LVLFGLRFDLRNPDFAGVPMAARYQAALEMAAWADQRGALLVGVSEHHGSADGYLPSALAMAAAIAARTSNARIGINALVAPFHDPLRLAEDIAVVDLLSQGRLDITIGAGYVHEEFAMFGVELRERPARVTETIATLRAAWTGEAFEFRGRTVRVLPTPFQPGGPRIMMGGSSEPAARRAARIADGFIPSEPEMYEFYRDECRQLGKPDPGDWYGGGTTTTFVSEDPDRDWERLAPYFLHETNAYGSWQAVDDINTGYRPVADVDELRASGRYRLLTPDDYVAELREAAGFAFAMLHPMAGGIPPELAWENLELFDRRVLTPLSDTSMPAG